MKKINLWIVSFLALLLVAGCGQQQEKQQAEETTTQEAVTLDGEWQAVDFRDTLERTFLFAYRNANSRLKMTEAFQDVVPTLKIEGSKVTFSYTADLNKYFEFYAEEKKIETKEEAAKILAEVAKRAFAKSNSQSGTYNDETYLFKASLEDGALDTTAKTIVFQDVPNIFGIIPLFITSKEIPITYHYEVKGDILTMYAEISYKESGVHMVYPMTFKKVQN